MTGEGDQRAVWREARFVIGKMRPHSPTAERLLRALGKIQCPGPRLRIIHGTAFAVGQLLQDLGEGGGQEFLGARHRACRRRRAWRRFGFRGRLRRHGSLWGQNQRLRPGDGLGARRLRGCGWRWRGRHRSAEGDCRSFWDVERHCGALRRAWRRGDHRRGDRRFDRLDHIISASRGFEPNRSAGWIDRGLATGAASRPRAARPAGGRRR